MSDTKQCGHCKKKLPLSEFSKHCKDNLQSWCRACCKKWQKEYRQVCNNDSVFVTHRRVEGLKNFRKQHNTLRGYLRYVFHHINSRCSDPNNADYARCGGLGIKCLFKNANEFIDYVTSNLGHNTLEKLIGLRLARIDIAGNFEPGNLRLLTTSQRSHGNRKQRTSILGKCSSRLKGTSRDEKRDKWRAYIKVNEKHKYLGRFDDEEDAGRAYDEAALKYFGEYALTNQDMNLY